MNEQREISVRLRVGHGKGDAHKLRAKGLIPAIVYGGGGKHMSVSLDPRLLRKAMDPVRKLNTWFKVNLEDESGKVIGSESCIVIDHQMEKTRDQLLHVDFLRVDPEKELRVRLPVEVSGRSVGVVAGGTLKTFLRYVHVSVRPRDIPTSLAVDVTPLASGQTLKVKDMTIPGGRILENQNQNLAFIDPPKAKKEEDEAAGKDGKKPAAGAKAAAAKPAAAAAPAAKPAAAKPKK